MNTGLRITYLSKTEIWLRILFAILHTDSLMNKLGVNPRAETHAFCEHHIVPHHDRDYGRR